MNKITSFTINHDVLKPGFYISRIDGDIVTYDIRMVTPNAGRYLTNPALHTFEHLFATYVRNSALTDSIVYVGPMGCRTGFYFLTRGITHQQALDLFRDTLDFIAAFDALPLPIIEVHFSGNRSYKDEHMYLSYGTVPLDAICRGMKRRGFDGFATMEIVFHDWTLDQAFDYAVSSRELFLKHWAEA